MESSGDNQKWGKLSLVCKFAWLLIVVGIAGVVGVAGVVGLC